MCFLTGRELRIEMANPSMLAAWGRDESVIGKPLEEAIPEIIEQPFPVMLREVLDTGIPMRGNAAKAYHYIKGKLTTFYYDFSFRAVTTSEGIQGVAVIAYDVTDQVREKKARDRFISVVSHQFNTPLTSVMAYGQVIEKELREGNYAKCQELVAKMNANTRKLSKLVEELLDVASFEPPRPVSQHSFTCADVVDEVLTEMNLGQAVQVAVPEQIRACASVSTTKKILKYLIENAVRFSPVEQSVSLSATTLNEQVVKFMVSDRGVGISKDEQTRIFGKYYKSTRNGLPWQNGLGVGLFKASKLVQAEGGQLWVESNGLNQGAAFCFTLRNGIT